MLVGTNVVSTRLLPAPIGLARGGAVYGSTVYACGNCGRPVSKGAQVCPHCSVGLTGIRCRTCGFEGAAGAFVDDRCPHCSAITIPSAQERAPASPSVHVCPSCGSGAVRRRSRKEILWGGLTCAVCGVARDRRGHAIAGPGVPSTDPPTGWRADPAGRHELRYFEHGHPTQAVSDDGVMSSDPLPIP